MLDRPLVLLLMREARLPWGYLWGRCFRPKLWRSVGPLYSLGTVPITGGQLQEQSFLFISQVGWGRTGLSDWASLLGAGRGVLCSAFVGALGGWDAEKWSVGWIQWTVFRLGWTSPIDQTGTCFSVRDGILFCGWKAAFLGKIREKWSVGLVQWTVLGFVGGHQWNEETICLDYIHQHCYVKHFLLLREQRIRLIDR